MDEEAGALKMVLEKPMTKKSQVVRRLGKRRAGKTSETLKLCQKYMRRK